ncbi:MAG: 2-C-methyl-D-erythritol 2,4-cyclodiphosphate synthase [Gemmatimonadales bacterium]
MKTRVGIGYDSHRFAEGTGVVLGGVRIPAPFKLVGHSDGDAIAHALTDAILGGAGVGDIGELFPDSDPVNKGRDSIEMLHLALHRVRAAGWTPVQADISVICERPRVGPYREEIRASLARALGIETGAVMVKGKTNEKLGWIGKEKGLAVIAVATLEPV